MVKYSIILFFVLLSCNSIKTIELKDGFSEVPAGSNFFDINYREKYKIVIPENVDFNALFIESYYITSMNQKFKFDITQNGFISAFKLYSNGCVSKFLIGKENPISSFDPNPEEKGYRGICYEKDQQTFIDIIAPVNEIYSLGKIKYEASFTKDTLYLKNVRTKTTYVYAKYAVEVSNYRSSW